MVNIKNAVWLVKKNFCKISYTFIIIAVSTWIIFLLCNTILWGIIPFSVSGYRTFLRLTICLTIAISVTAITVGYFGLTEQLRKKNHSTILPIYFLSIASLLLPPVLMMLYIFLYQFSNIASSAYEGITLSFMYALISIVLVVCICGFVVSVFLIRKRLAVDVIKQYLAFYIVYFLFGWISSAVVFFMLFVRGLVS